MEIELSLHSELDFNFRTDTPKLSKKGSNMTPKMILNGPLNGPQTDPIMDLMAVGILLILPDEYYKHYEYYDYYKYYES